MERGRARARSRSRRAEAAGLRRGPLAREPRSPPPRGASRADRGAFRCPQQERLPPAPTVEPTQPLPLRAKASREWTGQSREASLHYRRVGADPLLAGTMQEFTDKTAPHQIPFEAFGLEIRFCTNSPELLERVEPMLPPGWRRRPRSSKQMRLGLLEEDDDVYSIYRDANCTHDAPGREYALKILEMQLSAHITSGVTRLRRRPRRGRRRRRPRDRDAREELLGQDDPRPRAGRGRRGLLLGRVRDARQDGTRASLRQAAVLPPPRRASSRAQCRAAWRSRRHGASARRDGHPDALPPRGRVAAASALGRRRRPGDARTHNSHPGTDPSRRCGW